VSCFLKLRSGCFNVLFINESKRSINMELGRVLAPKGSKPIIRINNLRGEGALRLKRPYRRGIHKAYRKDLYSMG